MNEKVLLENVSDSETFWKHYFLKEELTIFLRNRGLSASGSKAELSERIARFLDTGKVDQPTLKSVRKAIKPLASEVISDNAVIPTEFVCSEASRAYFKEKIGKSFTFNVSFQNWLKQNAGKTYLEAVGAYRMILKEKKTRKNVIGAQFEYNTYVRDFFSDNENKTLREAIACWNFKKSQEGNHRYEPSDLKVLENEKPKP